jgi:uridine phosphorylase
MEAAAFFAVSQFRKIIFGQILYGGDDVGSEKYEWRDWNRATLIREQIFEIAVEACFRLP